MFNSRFPLLRERHFIHFCRQSGASFDSKFSIKWQELTWLPLASLLQVKQPWVDKCLPIFCVFFSVASPPSVYNFSASVLSIPNYQHQSNLKICCHDWTWTFQLSQQVDSNQDVVRWNSFAEWVAMQPTHKLDDVIGFFAKREGGWIGFNDDSNFVELARLGHIESNFTGDNSYRDTDNIMMSAFMLWSAK